MLKRVVKRRVRNIFLTFLYVLVGVFLSVGIFFLFKNFLPVVATDSKSKIIGPVGIQAGAVEIRRLLNEKNIQFEQVPDASRSGGIVFQLKEGPIIIFSETADPAWQVSSLQLILSRLTIDNKKVSSIDLSEGKPIVKFGGL